MTTAQMKALSSVLVNQVAFILRSAAKSDPTLEWMFVLHTKEGGGLTIVDGNVKPEAVPIALLRAATYLVAPTETSERGLGGSES